MDGQANGVDGRFLPLFWQQPRRHRHGGGGGASSFQQFAAPAVNLIIGGGGGGEPESVTSLSVRGVRSCAGVVLSSFILRFSFRYYKVAQVYVIATAAVKHVPEN